MSDNFSQNSSFLSIGIAKSVRLFFVNIYKMFARTIDSLFVSKLNNNKFSQASIQPNMVQKAPSIITRFLQKRKKTAIDRVAVVLLKKEQKLVLPIEVKSEDQKCTIVTIFPQLDKTDSYKLKWIRQEYSLADIELPKDNCRNLQIWQEISKLLQESHKIDRKIFEQRAEIPKYQEKKKLVLTAPTFSKLSEKYDRLISKLEQEITTGEKLHQNIYQLIRDYLISMEIEEVSPINIINEIESSKQKSKELGTNLESKYNSLRIELDSYLETIDDYSELMESLEYARTV
jgi:hypothetical protein